MLKNEAKKLRTDSITTRFVTATMLTVICMCVMVWTQVYFEKKLALLHQQKVALLELSNDLLQMRRHEKDYLMRQDASYLTLHEQRGQAFVSALKSLQMLSIDIDQNTDLIRDSITSFQTYQDNLKVVATKIAEIGYSENEGVQLKFRSAIHALEQALEAQNALSAHVIMLQIRRAEKDFMLRKRLSYVTKVNALVNQLEFALAENNQNNAIALLHDYRDSFNKLVMCHQELGLTHKEGLRHTFRTASHQLEDSLDNMTAQLTPEIIKREERVRLSRAIIIVINLALLLFLMVNSFRSINNALKSFTAFFQKSKTNMSTLDIDQFHLQEFKSMAEMANSMIEARQSAEIKLQEAMNGLSQANDKLTDLASRDALTQLPNRRALDKCLNEEWDVGLHNTAPLAIVLIDIDHFKTYNDHYGHAKGDNALIRVGDLLSDYAKATGHFVARYGGEEFLFVLANTDSATAMESANELVSLIQNAGIPHDASPTAKVLTISAGVYAATPEKHLSINSWITKADNALYQSKGTGRNRASLFEE